MSLSELCKRLGISTQWGPAHASKVVMHALAAVNAHLKTLDAQALADPYNVKLPLAFEVKEVGTRADSGFSDS